MDVFSAPGNAISPPPFVSRDRSISMMSPLSSSSSLPAATMGPRPAQQLPPDNGAHGGLLRSISSPQQEPLGVSPPTRPPKATNTSRGLDEGELPPPPLPTKPRSVSMRVTPTFAPSPQTQQSFHQEWQRNWQDQQQGLPEEVDDDEPPPRPPPPRPARQ